MSWDAVQRKPSEEKRVELESIRDMISELSEVGTYYSVRAPSAPLTEFLCARKGHQTSIFGEETSVIRIFEVDRVLSSRFGIAFALNWERGLLSSKPFLEAVDNNYERIVKDLNMDAQLMARLLELKPSLLETSYIGDGEQGPGVYGAPEIMIRKPTMCIEMRFPISKLGNTRETFLSGLRAIKRIEHKILSDRENH